jgi:hypothetical protein
MTSCDPYSTISFLRLWTNATASSDSGTLNFAKVAAACPRNTFQSLAYIRAAVGQQHFSAPVVDRSTRALAQEINQKLLLALDAIFSAVRPETTELRIFVEPQQRKLMAFAGDGIDHQREGHRARFSTERIEPK